MIIHGAIVVEDAEHAFVAAADDNDDCRSQQGRHKQVGDARFHRRWRGPPNWPESGWP